MNGEFSAFLELGVGFNPELTARENIFLGGAMLGLTRAQLRDKVDEVLAFAELEDFAEQKLKNFSSGMQVRLAFSVAILGQTDLLVMDEVLAVGDASFQEKCFDTFNRYKREGKTIVLVSHNLGSLEEYCDRVLLLNHGAIVADGPATEVTGIYQRMVADHALAAERDLTTEVVHGDPNRTADAGDRIHCRRALLNASGQNTRRFDTGTPLTMDMELLVHRDIGDFVCGMAIRRADGLLVAGTNTLMDKVSIPRHLPGDKVSVRYTINSLPLLAGGYIVQVSLFITRPGRPSTTGSLRPRAFASTTWVGTPACSTCEVGGRWSRKRTCPHAPSARFHGRAGAGPQHANLDFARAHRMVGPGSACGHAHRIRRPPPARFAHAARRERGDARPQRPAHPPRPARPDGPGRPVLRSDRRLSGGALRRDLRDQPGSDSGGTGVHRRAHGPRRLVVRPHRVSPPGPRRGRCRGGRRLSALRRVLVDATRSGVG